MLNVFNRVCRGLLVAACLLGSVAQAQNDAGTRRAAIAGMYPVMLGALQAKNFGRARNICDQAILWEPQNPVHHYNLACIEAQAGGERLPYAWGALDLAVALGFNDVSHLRTDPDLAPLRRDPKFADLVRKIEYSEAAGTAIESLAIPEAPSKPVAPPTPALGTETLAPAGFTNGVPVGLYLMNRYNPSTQSLETSVWYFAPDQRVYRDFDDDFPRSTSRRSGKVSRTDRTLEINWSDGSKSVAEMERNGAGFDWDMAIFTPVTAFESSSDAAGVYEGAEPVIPGGKDAPVAQRLTLRADGTFTWEGVSIVASSTGDTHVATGSSAVTDGRWELSGLSLVLKHSENVSLQRMIFPLDDDETVIRPDRMFFGGLIYKRRP